MSIQTSIQTWAEQTCSAYRTGRWSHEAHHTIKIFQALLEGSLSGEEAARRISAVFEPRLYDGVDKEDCSMLVPWGLVSGAAQAMGESEEVSLRLIALMDAFREITVKDRSGQPIKVGGGVVWRDWPSFGWMFAEYSMFGIGTSVPILYQMLDLLVDRICLEIRDIEDLDWDWDEWWSQATPHQNITSFAARWLKTRRHMHWYVVGSLSQAIEANPETPEELEHTLMYVPPATIWIMLAGKTILQLCKDNYHRSHPRSVHNSDLWKGDLGFSVERWIFWKKRFGEIAALKGIPSHVAEISLRAMAEMQKIQDEDI